jgi:Uma2 family endonuclease
VAEMTTMVADSGFSWAYVLQTWNELNVPEGWRPEITPEGIFMSPPPIGSHNLIADELHHAVGTAIDRSRFGVFQTQGVAIRSIGGIFVPDLCVAERAAVPHGSEPVESEHVVLAVEITSRSNAHHDRKRKKWAYAHGGIGQYLLVDAFDEDGPTVSLFSNPVDGIYRNTIKTPFGQKITLAAPVSVVIDTASFPFGARPA